MPKYEINEANIPEPVDQKAVRRAVLELMQMVENDEIISIMVVAERAGEGEYMYCSTTPENMYARIGYMFSSIVNELMNREGADEDDEEEDDDDEE